MPAPPSLDPFSLPPETNVRFMLLLVAALMLAANVGVLVPYVLDASRESPFGATPQVEAGSAGDFFPAFREQSSRTALTALAALGLPLGLGGAVLGCAAVLYRAYPSWIRRREALLPPPEATRDEALTGEVAGLAQRSGISPPPPVALRPSLRTQHAQVFGSSAGPVLMLDRGLQVQLRKDPETFRAILLHELAHISNHDIGRTYFAQSLWFATTGIAVAPVILALAFFLVQGTILRLLSGTLALDRLLTVNLPPFLTLAVQVAGALLVVLATRASLLRVREEYADWRANLNGAALASILRRNALAPGSPAGPPLRRRLFRLHPEPRERLHTLLDSTRLFRMTLDLPFLAGILEGFVLAGLLTLVIPAALSLGSAALSLAALAAEEALLNEDYGSLLLAWAATLASVPLILLSLLVPMWGAAYLLAGSVGLQAQREALKDLVISSRPRRASPTGPVLPAQPSTASDSGLPEHPHGSWLGLALPAAALSAGIEVGFLLAPLGFLALRDVPATLGQLIFACFSWAILIYARWATPRVLGGVLSPRPPVFRRRALTLILSAVHGFALLPLLASRVATIPGLDPDTAVLLAGVAFAGFLFTALLLGSLALFTLAFTASPTQPRDAVCPTCGRRQRTAGSLAGSVCAGCESPLTPWLFASPPTGAPSR